MQVLQETRRKNLSEKWKHLETLKEARFHPQALILNCVIVCKVFLVSRLQLAVQVEVDREYSHSGCDVLTVSLWSFSQQL